MVSSIYEKLRECFQKQDSRTAEQLLSATSEEELLKAFRNNLTSTDFIETWNSLLTLLRDTPRCHQKRISLIMCVLKEVEEKDLLSSRASMIENSICLELTKFKSEHLAMICNFCLERLQSLITTKIGWKDLLPEVLNVLVERGKFTYNDFDYTGAEYKTEFINTLCFTNWSPNIVTSLASIFCDMPLNKQEHLKLVNKLATYIEKLMPQEVPALVYQLIKLCRQQNGRTIFLKLQYYFGLRIYNSTSWINESSPNSNTNIDAIESTNIQDTIEAESTVLFHIHTATSVGHECIRDYLNSIKNMIKAPELILHPFQLMVLFTISTVPYYEESVFEIIRPCIVRCYNEEQRKNNSCWFKDMVHNDTKPEVVMSQVVNFCAQERVILLPALVNFAFILLGIGSGLGRDPIAEQQWSLGSLILLKIMKRTPSAASTILRTFSNHILTRQSAQSSQYIECLFILSERWPLLLLENMSCMIELTDTLVQVPAQVANQLLDPLIRLIKLSPTLRDHLIIILRKALYSRPLETREMSVKAFLKMISHLKVVNLTTLSQSNNGSFASGHSIYTQLSMSKISQNFKGGSFSNEALCLEILSILQRCFMQQVELRIQLYEGFYNTVCMNPELGISILDLMWFHFITYYVMDEEMKPPLDFKKITTLKGADCVLQEPIGKLIYTIGLILIEVSKNEDNLDNNTVIKFTNIFDSLCERMRNSELVHFELDDGTDLLDVVPESQAKMHTLKEAMSVYEALMGYKIASWVEQTENRGKIVYDLFQGYARLSAFSKSLSKPKKAEGKRKKGDSNKSTQHSQTNANIRKEAAKHSKHFKAPDTVLDFRVVIKALALLYEPKISWAGSIEASTVKSKREIHQHFMNVTMFLIQRIKKHKDIDNDTRKHYFDYISEVSNILYTRIIRRLNEVIDFDCMTAVLALECFNLILTVVLGQYKANFKRFLEKIVDVDENGLVPQLKVLMDIYQKLFETDEEELSEDVEVKKLLAIVITTLNTLCTQIPNDNNVLSVQMLDWLKHYACHNTLPLKVSSPFINLFFDINIRFKVSLTLFENMSLSIGKVTGVITEEEATVEDFKIINEGTVNNILLAFCSTIKSILEDIDTMIARLKAEYHILIYPGVDNLEKKRETLKNSERGVCCQICFLVSILTNLNNLLVPSGNISEAIFGNLIKLFNTLTLLTKHFTTRSSKTNLAFEGARFERLVKLTGRQLSPVVYKFIIHIDESQKQEAEQTKQKKKNVDSGTLKSRVLKQTKLIPKVVYEMEQFGKCIIQLSNKTKVDLSKYVGQGVARDYRILDLRKILETTGGVENIDMDDSVNSAGGTDESRREIEEKDDDDENEIVDSTPPPPAKKAKK